MALLTGPAILEAIKAGSIKIDPFDLSLLGTNSYDCHLGPHLRVYDRHRGRLHPPAAPQFCVIDSENPPPLVDEPPITLPDGRVGWVLRPGTLYFGRTVEYTETWGFVPRIDGRSTCGRLGVFGHITAGQGDNGFCGTWTLEITCVEPVFIRPGQRLFQFRYDTQEGEQILYGKTGNTSGRYQHQIDPTGPRDPKN